MRQRVLAASSILIVLPSFGAALASADDVFEAPYRLQAGGEYIDVDIGHAAPHVYDMNSDGKRDLLVGQFGEGKLRIYWNVGTNEAPQYAGHEWFKADHEFGTVPSG